MPSKSVKFTNKNGYQLAAKIDFPLNQKPKAYAVFAHVFTGNKNFIAAKYISRGLTLSGIAVLRFDFTGLGDSEGDFSDTNFSSNIEDVVAACDFLSENYEAPQIMIGHSLGGAAAIFAAKRIDSIRAVATIGTPSEPAHVTHLLQSSIDEIEKTGEAIVSIGGRQFNIKKQFLEDLQKRNMFKVLKDFRKAILVLHSPQDEIVEIDNAAEIYHAAFHPKSFVTLNQADHLLTKKSDAHYTGNLIASWVDRYIDLPEINNLQSHREVMARLGTEGFTTEILAGKHGLIADEGENLGGNDFGPSPYELLNAALGACTAMTLQMYARRKKWPVEEVKVHLFYERSYLEDCQSCEEKDEKLDTFHREIEIIGDLSTEQKNRLLEIANRCPVHKTLETAGKVYTRLL